MPRWGRGDLFWTLAFGATLLSISVRIAVHGKDQGLGEALFSTATFFLMAWFTAHSLAKLLGK